MPLPNVVLVASDKGGTGKTTISRAMLDYYAARNISCRAFDTEVPQGILKRFHPDKVEIADLASSDGQMKILDGLKAAQVTLIDGRAGLLSPTLRMLAEIGFLSNGIVEGRLKIVVVHVVGSTVASLNEIRATSRIIAGAKHLLAVSHINDTSFAGLTEEMKATCGGVIEIGKLTELAADQIDAAGVSFAGFIADENNSPVLRGYVSSWLRRVFKEFDAAKLNEV
jgi:hypothetical protein